MQRNLVCEKFSRFGTFFLSSALMVAATALLSGCVESSSGANPWNAGTTSSKPAAAPTTPTSSSAATSSAAPSPALAGTAAPTMGQVPVLPSEAKVAILLPLSGKGADTGQSMLNAAQLAMFDIGGGAFELKPKDTNQGAVEAASAAINEGARLILGPVFGADTKAVAPIAAQKGINVLSFSTDTTATAPNSFLMGFVPETQVQQIVDFSANQGFSRIALIAPHDAYGDAVATTFTAYTKTKGLASDMVLRFDPASGLSNDQLIAFTKRPPTPPAMAGGYKAMNAMPFDAVLIATSGPAAGKISDQLTALGLPPVAVHRLGTGLWDQPEVARIPSLQSAWYAASSPNLRRKFEKRYTETYGEAPTRLSSLAYDATALAIILAKSGRGYSRETLTNANGFAGIDGIFRFRPDGLAERGLAILEIRNNIAVVVNDAPTSFAPATGYTPSLPTGQ